MNTGILGIIYLTFFKPLLFLFDPEKVHELFVKFGTVLGRSKIMRAIFKKNFHYTSHIIEQEVFGKRFDSPVGLSAGFDYNGHLSQILGSVGFGFESIGTVSYQPSNGNDGVRLTRLPKSKSILVNKGFKNDGIVKILNENVKTWEEDFNVGLSIGATNSPDVSTTEKQIADILNSFKFLKKHPILKKLTYLEVNISCPNVSNPGSLAHPEPLKKVLKGISSLKLNKPLIVKFQLEIEWNEAKELIQIMIDNGVKGIVLANLLKKRDPSKVNKEELDIVRNLKGNFSGKPTFDLSNELIEKVYKEFGKKIIIIGAGGIFSAEDAYEKIKRGATLVQLITGMIYKGPQLIGDINRGLERLIKKDGYRNIKEAIGTGVK